MIDVLNYVRWTCKWQRSFQTSLFVVKEGELFFGEKEGAEKQTPDSFWKKEADPWTQNS